MTEPIYEVIEREDKQINIHYDGCPSNPRLEFDNLGSMVCFHRRYNLGDTDHGIRHEDFDNWGDMERGIIDAEGDSVIMPLYLYDHSGLSISTDPYSCPWDSGQVGFIYVSKAAIRAEYSKKRVSRQLREKVERILSAEVEVYDCFLSGRVYGYTVTDVDGSEIDSCWGFYGEDWAVNGLLDYADGGASVAE